MKFFRTLAQRRILKYYWKNNKPFTLNDLLEKRILHFVFWGRLTLLSMEIKRQIRPHYVINGRVQYIGTTDSEAEWKRIDAGRAFGNSAMMTRCFTEYGLNRYERDDLIAWMDEFIENFKNQPDGSEDA